MIAARIVSSFEVAGRGTVVIIDARTELPVGRPLDARIERPGSPVERYQAWKEWIRQAGGKPPDNEGFLLVGASKDRLPIGTLIELRPEDSQTPTHPP